MVTKRFLSYLLILFLTTALFQVVTHSMSFVRAQSVDEPPPPQSSDYYLNPENYQITPAPTISISGGSRQEVRPLDTGSYTVSDDFTGTTVNDQNWWQPNSYTTVANNQLKMQLGADVKNRGTDIWSKKRFKGDFQAEIDLANFQTNTAGYADARFWMNNDWAGWISMDLRLNNQSDPRGDLFCTVRYLDNNNNPVFLDIGRDNLDSVPVTANLRLRITRVGNTVSCSYNSGNGFIVLGSKEVPDWADRVFQPYISSWKGSADNVTSTAIWDNFTASGTLTEPVGLWYMNEGSGQTVGDSSGKSNNGTATGTSIVYGKHWNGRSFNGTSDYVALSSQPPLKDGFTFESWVNFDSGVNFNNHQEIFNNNQFFIRKDNSSEGNKISAFVRLNDNSLESRVNSTTVPAPGKWYHVATTWNGEKLKMYINGKLEGEVERKGSLSASVVQAQFGRGEGTGLTSNPLAGILDEVKIYNYVRTPFQIHEDMLGWAQTTQTVTDNFESPSLDLTKWSVGKTNDAIQVSQTNGGVYMTIPGNIPNGSGILELKQRISSDFNFDIDLGSYQMDTPGGQLGTAEIKISQSGKLFALRWVKDNPGPNFSYIDYYMWQNGQVDDGPAYVIPGNSYPRVRLMRKGRVFYGAVYNGYGWQPVFMVDGFRGDNDTVSFTLNKGNGGTSTQDVKVYFDNLWGVYNNNCVRGILGNLDCSGNGLVDTADFELFRQNFGKPIGSVDLGLGKFSPDIFVDVNDQIDTADFEIFRSNFGLSGGITPTISPTNVPSVTTGPTPTPSPSLTPTPIPPTSVPTSIPPTATSAPAPCDQVRALTVGWGTYDSGSDNWGGLNEKWYQRGNSWRYKYRKDGNIYVRAWDGNPALTEKGRNPESDTLLLQVAGSCN